MGLRTLKYESPLRVWKQVEVPFPSVKPEIVLIPKPRIHIEYMYIHIYIKLNIELFTIT